MASVSCIFRVDSMVSQDVFPIVILTPGSPTTRLSANRITWGGQPFITRSRRMGYDKHFQFIECARHKDQRHQAREVVFAVFFDRNRLHSYFICDWSWGVFLF